VRRGLEPAVALECTASARVHGFLARAGRALGGRPCTRWPTDRTTDRPRPPHRFRGGGPV